MPLIDLSKFRASRKCWHTVSNPLALYTGRLGGGVRCVAWPLWEAVSPPGGSPRAALGGTVPRSSQVPASLSPGRQVGETWSQI